jgi:neutral ceramidase
MRIGAARVEITPLRSVPLAGYPAVRLFAGGPSDHRGYTGRLGPSEGVHDPLYARALVAVDASKTVVLVSLDVCLISQSLTSLVRKAAASRWGIDPEGVCLAATHTHSAQDYSGFWDPIDEVEETFVVEMTLTAIGRALAVRREARLGLGEGLLEELIINRRDPTRPVDPKVSVIRADDELGRPIAIVFCYACHPIVVGPQDRLVSADYPGHASALIESAMGSDCVALFLNGAAGNINPVAFPYVDRANISSLAKEFALQGRQVDFRTHLDAHRFGTALGAEVVRVAAMVECRQSSDLGFWRKELTLGLKNREELEAYIYHENLSARRAAELVGKDSIESEIMAIRLGESLLLALPGEPFVEIGLELQQPADNWPSGPRVRVFGYANDYPEYVLRAQDYAENRYESVSTCLSVAGSEAIIAGARVLRDEALGLNSSTQRAAHEFG